MLDRSKPQFLTVLTVAAGALALPPLSIGVRADNDPTTAPIPAVYKECRAAGNGPSRSAYAVYTDGDFTKAPRWMRRKPAKATVVETLTVHRAAGKLRLATLGRASPSGDWSQRFEYCYRADGSLAFVLGVLRTFQGRVRVVDRFYYDRSGKRLRKDRRIFDLGSGKRLAPGARSFNDVKPVILKTTRAVVRYARPALGR
jgi:hypothetical protein